MSARVAEGSPPDELLDDHDADGIREFGNDLPRWWLYGFYLTIVFAAVYLVNYHVLPQPAFGRAGMVAEYEAELQAAARAAERRAPSAPSGQRAALTDADSLEKGRAIFERADSACSSCHRNDLGGLVGPDLTDDSWMHGCSIDAVAASIRNGYPLKGMLPYGIGKPLGDEQLLQLASYVLSQRGSAPPNPKPAEAGRETECP